MNRRRFLALVSTASAGLWLRETGLIAMPRRMVLELTGPCSFCGKSPHELFGLAAVAGGTVRICDDCIGLCLDIIEEDEHPERMMEREAARKDYEPMPETPDEIADYLERFGIPKSSDEFEAIFAAFKKALVAKPEPRSPRNINLACSFCGLNQREARKLIAGPTVYICDTCIADAASLFARTGWTRR